MGPQTQVCTLIISLSLTLPLSGDNCHPTAFPSSATDYHSMSLSRASTRTTAHNSAKDHPEHRNSLSCFPSLTDISQNDSKQQQQQQQPHFHHNRQEDTSNRHSPPPPPLPPRPVIRSRAVTSPSHSFAHSTRCPFKHVTENT